MKSPRSDQEPCNIYNVLHIDRTIQYTWRNVSSIPPKILNAKSILFLVGSRTFLHHHVSLFVYLRASESRIYLCIRVCMSVCIYASLRLCEVGVRFIYINLCICVHECTLHTYISMCVSVYIYINIYIYMDGFYKDGFGIE